MMQFLSALFAAAVVLGDKRNAIEIIIEERTGLRDPEDKDGDLPQLERPKRPG